MITKPKLSLIFLTLFAGTLYAEQPPKLHPSHPLHLHAQRLQDNIWLNNNNYYESFHFKSTKGGSTNQYRGDTQIYPLTLWYKVNTHWMFGANYSKLLTAVHSDFLVPAYSIYNKTDINGNSYGLHVRKIWNNFFYVEAYGSYYDYRYKLHQKFVTSVSNREARVNYNGFAWTTGASTGAAFPIGNDWILSGSLNFLYLKVKQDGFNLAYNNGSSSGVLSLAVSTANLIESITAYYLITRHIRPFLNIGSIQVLNREQSRPTLTDTSSISAVPALTLAGFGYHVGTGLEFTWRHFSLYAGYYYAARGNTFNSNSGLLSLNYFN